MIELEFHGAAQTVTGSNYLVKTGKLNFIVDCGMFQGPDVEGRNLEEYEYDASQVKFVLLTHAHIDHCGMLPKLYRSGFRGKIFATNHTIQVSSLLLLDSAKIQEQNFQRGENFGKYTNKVALAYHSKDAEDTLGLFNTVNFNEDFSPAEGITVRYLKAGHILGAASIEVTIETENGPKTILFSGDIGRANQSLIGTFDPDYRSTPDYVLIEALYGGVEHPAREQSVDKMVEIINKTIKRGGNVLIPAFAVQRTQEILHDIKTAKLEGKLSNDLPVWLDSPLAQNVSRIYTASLQSTPESLFDFPNLRYVKKYKQSLKLQRETGNIIIAGSGMADGGRIVDHLAQGLHKRNNVVIFVGYQAEGTLGRELVEGAKFVEINKTKIAVNAEVHYLQGFSAHGDTSDYLQWLKRHTSDKLKKVFLVHAEIERAKGLDLELEKVGVDNESTYIPAWKEKVKLD